MSKTRSSCLNSLLANIVTSLEKLGDYPYCGHGALLGRKKIEWQDCNYVLRYFSEKKKDAQNQYLSFVESAHDQGCRPELTGGGLIRSLGGWSEIKKMRLDGHDRIKGDQRILGDEDFVDAVLSQAEEKYSHQQELVTLGYIYKVVEKVASIYNIKPDDVLKKGRQK